jgi:hypothetical protein
MQSQASVRSPVAVQPEYYGSVAEDVGRRNHRWMWDAALEFE